VSEIGSKVFFPASGAWSDEAVVTASSVAPLPGSTPDEVGAQMLINTVTALTAIRAAHDSLPPDERTGVFTLLAEQDPQSGASSARF
jgi:NADPH:quinone reductase-like Zn-dependent oxidoreductase